MWGFMGDVVRGNRLICEVVRARATPVRASAVRRMRCATRTARRLAAKCGEDTTRVRHAVAVAVASVTAMSSARPSGVMVKSMSGEPRVQARRRGA